MNWEAISAIGDIVGALAVFITLVYLALQTRQNTKAIHSSAFDSTVNMLSIVRQSIYENDEVAKAFLKGLATPDKLDDVERLKFRILLQNVTLAQANIFGQTRYAGIPLSEWQAQHKSIVRILRSPGGTWFWNEFASEFDAEFRAEMDRILKESYDHVTN